MRPEGQSQVCGSRNTFDGQPCRNRPVNARIHLTSSPTALMPSGFLR